MLNFEKVILHNFGSYGHAEVNLQNRGFCLVSGQNNFKKDNALSNGSGKSFIWSGVCFAITGETIQGLHTNLKNIHVEDDNTCYVTLYFKSNADSYVITRYVSPKSDLKIIKNGTDISGKGIRESEKKLGETLPDLTKDLVASTILIGQGMPNKLSSFSPSGRKELLEKLTKSDFMIEDIKNRITNRLNELTNQGRQCEDSLLANRTRLETATTNLNNKQQELDNAVKPNYSKQIKDLNDSLALIGEDIKKATDERDTAQLNADNKNSELLKATEAKNKELNAENGRYNKEYTAATSQKYAVESEIRIKNSEIVKLKTIKDVCPTCGQKLPNVVKPDTSVLEKEVERLTQELSKANGAISKVNATHTDELNKINQAYNDKINALKLEAINLRGDANKAQARLSSYLTAQATAKETLIRLTTEENNFDKYYSGLIKNINDLNQIINQLNNLIRLTNDSYVEIQSHLNIIKKMDNLVKRDFRGYLLTNIINYIDNKAKDYSEIVFGTRDLNVYLDGNALDISYCNKLIDNLSGGEKQRVDLILQFALRDLLNAYFNLGANILVLDEITDFLDSKSCAAVMQLIEKELNSTESVFIVSHHAEELELPIDSEIKIVKNENGISEVL